MECLIFQYLMDQMDILKPNEIIYVIFNAVEDYPRAIQTNRLAI